MTKKKTPCNFDSYRINWSWVRLVCSFVHPLFVQGLVFLLCLQGTGWDISGCVLLCPGPSMLCPQGTEWERERLGVLSQFPLIGFQAARPFLWYCTWLYPCWFRGYSKSKNTFCEVTLKWLASWTGLIETWTSLYKWRYMANSNTSIEFN